jgi:uncharacterized alpha-E superfamily protein
VFNYEEQLNYEILESLLSSHESLNIYRYSYRSYLSIDNVVNLVLLDKEYPKSLSYQLRRIEKDIERLPIPKGTLGFSKSVETIRVANKLIRNIDTATLLNLNEDETLRNNLEDLLSELSDLLHETSLSISNTYFDHTYQQTQMVKQKIVN